MTTLGGYMINLKALLTKSVVWNPIGCYSIVNQLSVFIEKSVCLLTFAECW